MNRRQRLVSEGRCPDCGKWSYPYYYCTRCRMMRNLRRVLKKFEANGWVEVSMIDGEKAYKWKKGVNVGKLRKYSPEAIAKLRLPRLKNKPLTDKLIQDSIIEVITKNGMPLTMKEIQKGFKQLKTIGDVVPEVDDLIREYKLIKNKQSRLSRSKRDAVEFRINFLLKRGVIAQNNL